MSPSPASEPTPSSSLGVKVGVFGKLPRVGDFVRLGHSNETTRAFEEWLHQGIQYAHERRGSAWKTPFASGGIYAFVARVPLGEGRSGHLAGVLKPSQDSVGRHFPFAVFTPLPSDVPPHFLPLALGDFLDGAAQLALEAASFGSAAEVDARARSLSFGIDVESAARQYDWWTRTTSLADLWSAIYGSSDPGEPVTILGTLLEIMGPLRGRDPHATPLSVRLPLGQGGVVSTCFWLDLVRCGLRWKGVVPTFFWHFDGVRGDTLIQLGRTPSSSLVEIWAPDPRSEHVCDYVRPSTRQSDDSLRRLGAHVMPLLYRRAHVAELVDAFWY